MVAVVVISFVVLIEATLLDAWLFLILTVFADFFT
jgi:hypothetical protein